MITVSCLTDPRSAIVQITPLAGAMRPQSRPRFVARGGIARAYSSKSVELQAWRETLFLAMSRVVAEGFVAEKGEPIAVSMGFYFARPASHFTSKGAWTKSAPAYPGHNRGDADNLAKPVLDEAQRAGLLADDSQVHDLRVGRYFINMPSTTEMLTISFKGGSE